MVLKPLHCIQMGKSIKVANAKTVQERIDVIVSHFQRHKTRPATEKTLSNSINALFQKTLSDAEIALLVRKIQEQGIITIKETKVSYTLPE